MTVEVRDTPITATPHQLLEHEGEEALYRLFLPTQVIQIQPQLMALGVGARTRCLTAVPLNPVPVLATNQWSMVLHMPHSQKIHLYSQALRTPCANGLYQSNETIIACSLFSAT